MKEQFENCMFMYKLIWKFDKIRILLIFILAVVDCLQLLASTFFLKFMIDGIVNSEPLKYFIIVSSIRILAEVLSQAVHNYFESSIFEMRNNVVRNGFLKLIYNKVCEIDISAFDDADFYDKLSRAIDEAYQRPIWMVGTLTSLISMLLNTVALIVTLAYLSPFSIIIALVGGLFTFYCSIVSGRIEFEFRQKGTSIGRRLGYVERIFYLNQYAKDVRTTHLKDHMMDILDSAMRGHNTLIKKYLLKRASVIVLGEFVFSVLNLGVASVYICMQIRNNELSVGDFASISVAIISLSAQLSNFCKELTRYNEHSLFVNNLKAVLQYKTKLIFNEQGEKAEECNNYDIELKNVSFTYMNNDKESIKDISLKIKQGQKVAFVGENGAGKSTLLKLILHLYEANKGSISLGDTPYSEFNLESLYGTMAVVHQDFQAYALTIKENLMLYNDKAYTDEEIKSVLDVVGMTDVVDEAAAGLDTMMTREFDDYGINLSGGQNQRMAIARALCSKANVIIMDEPSSALDPLAEKELFDVIEDKIPASKTLIIVSHKLSGVKNMDNIFFMQNGAIVEQGRHDELMALDGQYAHMFRTQAERYGM